ncbi:MAG: hypothetical protein KDA27_14905 [Candidatus Eisenbacteria bacterium]|uniref:Glycosyltransferase RgtA/B/C/D-like domain-containing protein n=1 Tax=Eiseniibacteriota bacterium TaxID=2212470 RepID=A0A956NE36_UNCEI|nr:hypothetical protein [Candidatus Eisenbacteria bacterium]
MGRLSRSRTRTRTRRPADREPRKDRAWLFWLAAGAAVLVALVTFDPRLYVNGDNAEYLRMGQRVLEGDLWPSPKFPPLFPYLLAPLIAAFGKSVIPPKVLVLCAYIGAAILLTPVFRRRLGGPSGAALLFCALTAMPVLEFSHYVMSEVPFLLTLAATLLFADRITDQEPAASLRAALRDPTAWLLAVSLAAGFYIRTAGVAVGAGVAMALLLGRRRHEVVALVVLLLVLGIPWIAHSVTTPGGNPYVRQFLLVNPYLPEFGTMDATGLFLRVRYNVMEYFGGILPLSMLPIPYRSTYSPNELQLTRLPWPIAALLMLLLLVGVIRGLRNRDSVAWVFGSSLALILLWPPVWAGSRFLVPLVPLCFLLVGQGCVALTRLPGVEGSLRAPVRKAVGTALVSFLVLVSFVSIAKYERETAAYPVPWKNYFDALAWIRQNTPSDALVIDRKGVFVEWVADRHARGFPRNTDPEVMLAFFRDAGADYIVYPSLPYDDIQRYLVPAVAALPQYLSVEAVFGGDPVTGEFLTFVFRFHPEGGQNQGP